VEGGLSSLDSGTKREEKKGEQREPSPQKKGPGNTLSPNYEWKFEKKRLLTHEEFKKIQSSSGKRRVNAFCPQRKKKGSLGKKKLAKKAFSLALRGQEKEETSPFGNAASLERF